MLYHFNLLVPLLLPRARVNGEKEGCGRENSRGKRVEGLVRVGGQEETGHLRQNHRESLKGQKEHFSTVWI